MKIMDWVANKMGYTIKRTPTAWQFYRKSRTSRGFNAADMGDRFADWVTSTAGPNESVRMSLKRMRGRSRNLAENNDYMKKFLSMVVNNVVGPTGIKMQMKIEDRPGQLDQVANSKVEAAFKDWSGIKNASVTADISWLDIQKLALRSVARDGEVLIRKVSAFNNPFRFALQLIEVDHLDETHNTDLANGNRIRMGVELNSWGKPVAYHLSHFHPGDSIPSSSRQRTNRIPAEEIIHLFIKERPGQVRGIPWAHSTMVRLQMIGGYEEAELTGARAAASKMGFFEKEAGGSEYKGDDADADGNIISEFSPGTMEALPVGVKFKSFDPGNPSSNFNDFMKVMIRGASSGLNVSYNTLANDLEGVNFSSIRSGVLEEREHWKALQWWTIQHLHSEVFSAWLGLALLSGKVDLPIRKFEKFDSARWQPRGWAWVDPKKDIEANKIALDNKLKSHSEVVAEQGRDLEDVLTQIKADEALAEQIGVDLKTVLTEPNTSQKPDEDDTDED